MRPGKQKTRANKIISNHKNQKQFVSQKRWQSLLRICFVKQEDFTHSSL